MKNEIEIPEGCEAKIVGNKVVFVPKESEDERIRKSILALVKKHAVNHERCQMEAYLEKQKEPEWCHHKVDLSGCSEEYRNGYYDGWNNCNQQHSQLQAEQNPILEVFGFKVGDAVRLKDGDGRKHIIKSFKEVEGLHGPNFYHVEFEDNSARDNIYPGKEYPNGYYTHMAKFEEEQKPAESDAIKGGDFISDGKRVFLVLANAKERNLGETSSTFCEGLILGVDGVVYCNRDDFKKFKRATSDERAKFIHDLKVGVELKEQPAEWSEEDEAMLANVLGTYKTLEDMLNLSTGQDRDLLESMTLERDWLKDRFKSLRPQPHWKPSEEHFQGLRRAIIKAEKGSDAWNSLTDLYEHLKNL